MLDTVGKVKGKLAFLIDSYPWMLESWPTSKDLHQLCANTGCSLEDQSEQWTIGTDDRFSFFPLWTCVKVCATLTQTWKTNTVRLKHYAVKLHGLQKRVAKWVAQFQLKSHTIQNLEWLYRKFKVYDCFSFFVLFLIFQMIENLESQQFGK